jgi:hypothetical protein
LLLYTVDKKAPLSFTKASKKVEANPYKPMKLSRFVKLSFLAGAMALAGIFGGESKAESSVKIDLAYNITTVTNVRGGAISSATPAAVSGILLRPEPSIPSAAYIGAEAYAPVALIQFETLNVVQGGPDGRPLPRVRRCRPSLDPLLSKEILFLAEK